MRMFLYFFLHSSWNQLRSFVRSWAFVLFALLFAAGSVLWFGFVWYYRHVAAVNGDLPTSFADFAQVTGLTGLNVLELVAGLVICGLLVIQVIGAERSLATLFKQADVNLLFSSDLPPQTLLAFRVANSLGLAIAAAVFLALRLPFLAAGYALTPYGALSILLAWCLTLAFSMLLKILIYELGSQYPLFHRNLRWLVFALLAVVGLAFYRAYDTSVERDPFLTAQSFFNAPATRLVPIWGWIKGMMLCALEGDVARSLLLLGACVALIAALVLLARRLPADYYEQVLSSTQEAALLNEEANSEGAALLVMRARESVVTWEGFGHGWGSSVYFFRVFHDRHRSAPRFVTKTMLTYAFAALAAGLYVRHFLDDPLEYIPVLLLAVMVFFRTIVSPVTEDIRKDTFLLQPEPIWSKLFFSLLGGSCNCALDVALPLVIGSVAAGFSPVRGLVYVPMLMSVDFFASASGAFTDVSIPSSIGTSFKQVIQVILLYVGLIFDGVVLSSGITYGHSEVGFALVTLLDVLFGATFLGLTGVWLYPCKGRAVRGADVRLDLGAARSAYTRVGLAATAMFCVIRAAQLALVREGTSQLVALYLPIYALGLPVFLLAMGRGVLARAQSRAVRSLGLRGFVLMVAACFFVMYAGNVAGLLLQGLLSVLLPAPLALLQVDPSGLTESPVLQAALLSFAAPVMEELVFRRCVIDRLQPYGEKAALVVSALLFALFHASANQACYAFMLGLVFGYVYLKTGRLRYSMAAHVLINSMTAILLPAITSLAMGATAGMAPNEVQLADVITHPGVLALLLYVLILLVLSLLGSVVFLFGVRERELSPDGISVKAALSSWGIVVFLVLGVLALL